MSTGTISNQMQSNIATRANPTEFSESEWDLQHARIQQAIAKNKGPQIVSNHPLQKHQTIFLGAIVVGTITALAFSLIFGPLGALIGFLSGGTIGAMGGWSIDKNWSIYVFPKEPNPA